MQAADQPLDRWQGVRGELAEAHLLSKIAKRRVASL
jgi:hypothetical protein